jgi:hypothetical protein
VNRRNLHARLSRLEKEQPPAATSIFADGTIWDLLCGHRRDYTPEQLAEWAPIAERLQDRRQEPDPIEERIRRVGLKDQGPVRDEEQGP